VTADIRDILILGRNGQVARSLDATLTAHGYSVIKVGRPETDLGNPQTVINAIRKIRPAFVINAAAYTAVDRAEDEPEVARAANAEGAQAASKAAAEVGAPIIHFSTDYVFNGRKREPYLETDPVSPLGIYGQSKLAGETLVADANARHVILRTAWVFSPFGSNFAKTMLRLNQERPAINVVHDQHGNPTYAPDLAETVHRIIDRLRKPPPHQDCFGVFHSVNANPTTWYGFAQAIINGAAQRGAPRAAVHPIETKDYPTKAERPAYSVLSTDKLARVYGVRLRPWSDALSEALDLLVGPRHEEASHRPQQDIN
jgi:dTDP-4-dehydrorhamnose reductase